MARFARIIAPGYPHHVVQRGNRRQQTFFSEKDYQAYVDLLAERCRLYNVKIWGWCLMPNHLHLIAVPHDAEGLRLAIGKTHRDYSRRVNFREGWRGHLWQGRFASYPMDEAYLWQAARYVDLNPVRAGLVKRPNAWRWSSAPARFSAKVSDPLVSPNCPLLEAREASNWERFLAAGLGDQDRDTLQRHERTGRPLGDATFLRHLEGVLGRNLTRKKPGPKPRRG